MNRKKIVIVTDAWHPQINGVVTTLTQTVRCLEKAGAEVITITPEKFRTVPCPSYPEIRLALVRRKTVTALIRNIVPAAIHIATEGPLGWAARKACISLRVPFTTSYHTRYPEYIRLRAPVPLRLSYSVIRRFHNMASGIFVATEQLKDELRHRGFKRVRLWSRGVDTDTFSPSSGNVFKTDLPVFTYAGRVAPEKNIEAFLNLDLPGKKCVIGDGPALSELRRCYPQVLFTGYKKGAELSSYLASSNVFVFPSLTDTFGVVQLEAMSCGTPVAAFPVTGPKDLIINGTNGWIDNDLRQAAMKCLAINPADCRKTAMDFSWEKCTRQFTSNLVFH